MFLFSLKFVKLLSGEIVLFEYGHRNTITIYTYFKANPYV